MVFEGKPSAKTDIVNYMDGTVNPNANVLGVRAFFTQRGTFTLRLTPFSPIPIPGIVKSLSIWVSGRQMPNSLYVVLRDAKGIIRRIPFYDETGSRHLSFNGWRELKAIVPDDVRQKEYVYSRDPFITVLALELDFNHTTTEMGGEYFIYLDDLTAVTDMYSQNMRDADDLDDNWW
jgi:hypothetical protein